MIDKDKIQFFAVAHLPERLADVVAPFQAIAHTIVNTFPENSERTKALDKLIEAKDCAVRAMIFKPYEEPTIFGA